ncbi:MAG: beta-ketoacyl-ACP reductase [Bacteroidota bacterium]
MKFKNKVAVITGGASGIGKAAVQKFVREGAAVAIWDIHEVQGKELELLLLNEGFVARFIKVNTAKFEEVEHATKEVIKQFGKIDVLINNAGITRDASLQKMTIEQWQQVMDINLTGVFNCTKAVSPNMIQNNYGRIINTSSIVGLAGNYGQTNYGATKAGVINMAKTWARELGKHNITVNAVAPGFIETDMISTIPEKVIEMMKDKIPLKRLGTVEDIANAYAFLASDEAAFISGTVLSVDGGVTL